MPRLFGEGPGPGPALPARLVLAFVLLGPPVLAVAFVAVLLAGRGLVDGDGLVVFSDFSPYYLAAALGLEGEVGRLYDPALFFAGSARILGYEEAARPFWYAPSYLLLLLPFGLLPLPLAVAAWAGCNAAVMSAGLALGRFGRSATLAAMVFPGTLFAIVQGQNGALIAGLLGGALLNLRSHPVLAGILLGLATVKPQLGLLFPVALLAARRWQVIWVAAATAVAINLVSIAVFGTDLWGDHFAALLRAGDYLESELLPLPFMITVLSLARSLGLGHGAAQILQAGVFVAAAVMVYRVWSEGGNEQRKIAILILASFIATPYGYLYDLPLLALPLVWWAMAVADRPRFRGEFLVLAAFWLLPFAALLVTVFTGLQGWPVLLAILLALLWRRFGEDADHPSKP